MEPSGFWNKAYNFTEKLMNPMHTSPDRFSNFKVPPKYFKSDEMSTKYLWLLGTIAIGIGTLGAAHLIYHGSKGAYHGTKGIVKWCKGNDLTATDSQTRGLGKDILGKRKADKQLVLGAFELAGYLTANSREEAKAELAKKTDNSDLFDKTVCIFSENDEVHMLFFDGKEVNSVSLQESSYEANLLEVMAQQGQLPYYRLSSLLDKEELQELNLTLSPNFSEAVKSVKSSEEHQYVLYPMPLNHKLTIAAFKNGKLQSQVQFEPEAWRLQADIRYELIEFKKGVKLSHTEEGNLAEEMDLKAASVSSKNGFEALRNELVARNIRVANNRNEAEAIVPIAKDPDSSKEYCVFPEGDDLVLLYHDGIAHRTLKLPDELSEIKKFVDDRTDHILLNAFDQSFLDSANMVVAPTYEEGEKISPKDPSKNWFVMYPSSRHPGQMVIVELKPDGGIVPGAARFPQPQIANEIVNQTKSRLVLLNLRSKKISLKGRQTSEKITIANDFEAAKDKIKRPGSFEDLEYCLYVADNNQIRLLFYNEDKLMKIDLDPNKPLEDLVKDINNHVNKLQFYRLQTLSKDLLNENKLIVVENREDAIEAVKNYKGEKYVLMPSPLNLNEVVLTKYHNGREEFSEIFSLGSKNAKRTLKDKIVNQKESMEMSEQWVLDLSDLKSNPPKDLAVVDNSQTAVLHLENNASPESVCIYQSSIDRSIVRFCYKDPTTKDIIYSGIKFTPGKSLKSEVEKRQRIVKWEVAQHAKSDVTDKQATSENQKPWAAEILELKNHPIEGLGIADDNREAYEYLILNPGNVCIYTSSKDASIVRFFYFNKGDLKPEVLNIQFEEGKNLRAEVQRLMAERSPGEESLISKDWVADLKDLKNEPPNGLQVVTNLKEATHYLEANQDNVCIFQSSNSKIIKFCYYNRATNQVVQIDIKFEEGKNLKDEVARLKGLKELQTEKNEAKNIYALVRPIDDEILLTLLAERPPWTCYLLPSTSAPGKIKVATLIDGRLVKFAIKSENALETITNQRNKLIKEYYRKAQGREVFVESQEEAQQEIEKNFKQGMSIFYIYETPPDKFQVVGKSRDGSPFSIETGFYEDIKNRIRHKAAVGLDATYDTKSIYTPAKKQFLLEFTDELAAYNLIDPKALPQTQNGFKKLFHRMHLKLHPDTFSGPQEQKAEAEALLKRIGEKWIELGLDSYVSDPNYADS